MSEHEIILTDKIVKDWIEEIPNMRVATENYPGFSALAHAVVFEVLELSLLELVDLRARIAELEEAQEAIVCLKCNHWKAEYRFGGNSHFKNWICTGCSKSCKDCTCR